MIRRPEQAHRDPAAPTSTTAPSRTRSSAPRRKSEARRAKDAEAFEQKRLKRKFLAVLPLVSEYVARASRAAAPGSALDGAAHDDATLPDARVTGIKRAAAGEAASGLAAGSTSCEPALLAARAVVQALAPTPAASTKRGPEDVTTSPDLAADAPASKWQTLGGCDAVHPSATDMCSGCGYTREHALQLVACPVLFAGGRAHGRLWYCETCEKDFDTCWESLVGDMWAGEATWWLDH